MRVQFGSLAFDLPTDFELNPKASVIWESRDLPCFTITLTSTRPLPPDVPPFSPFAEDLRIETFPESICLRNLLNVDFTSPEQYLKAMQHELARHLPDFKTEAMEPGDIGGHAAAWLRASFTANIEIQLWVLTWVSPEFPICATLVTTQPHEAQNRKLLRAIAETLSYGTSTPKGKSP